MKAKTQTKKVVKKPKTKVQNEEPVQPIPELSYNDIVKECEKWGKMIVDSTNYKEYSESWLNFDKYTNLKNNYKK